ncbi:hypothetical protein PZA11_006565 [Diplocarpon coronariae]
MNNTEAHTNLVKEFYKAKHIPYSESRYMASRRAEGYKPTDKAYKAYLSREENGACSEDNKTDEDELETSSEEEDQATSEPKDNDINFTTVFLASNKEYDSRTVLDQLEKQKAEYLLTIRINKPIRKDPEVFTTQWTDQFWERSTTLLFSSQNSFEYTTFRIMYLGLAVFVQA